MSHNSKTVERFKEKYTVDRRVTNKMFTKFPPLKNRMMKRKSSNCLGSSDALSKAVGEDSEKTTISQKILQRRATMNCLTTSISVGAGKPRFLALGNKVKNLVKCKLAFQMKHKSSDGGIERANTMEVIHKMPTAARFSSFLSPEAQYSMMKGYEDVLRNQLVLSNPEYTTILVRNKTPMNRIGIRKQSKGVSSLKTTEEADDEQVFYSDDQDEQDTDEQSDQDVDWQTGVGQVKSESKQRSRRPSLPSSRNSVSRSLPSCNLKRTQSLQAIPHDRRLVMTYRLESAMDILDTIRHTSGQLPLSPRVVQKSRKITPITDYNSWATVWCKEFKIKI